jgi:surfeit locus 1 family protein
VVVVLAVLFVNLGLWQLDRRQERAIENTVMSARLANDALSLDDLLAAIGGDVSSLDYRPVEVAGTYRPDLEFLIRNQTNRYGVAGFDVITPLEYHPDRFVLINRGWVPLEMDTPPVGASPPSGDVTVTGVIRLTQVRPSIGPVEPEGQLEVASRIDIERLSQQIPGDLAPVWVQSTVETGGYPEILEIPTFDDPGPHLMYAIQWFAFALIGVVGYGFLIRREASGAARRRRSTSV